MRFDWYSCTLAGDPETVVPALSNAIDLSEIRPVRAFNGYQHAVQIVRGDRVFFTVSWGGENVGGLLHVQTTGDRSSLGSSVIRNLFPSHRVTRADVCEDYDDPTAFDFWLRYVRNLCKSRGISFKSLKSGLNGEGGRTIYIGAESSVVRLCIYEKGKKEGQSPDWVRVELRVRPKNKDARKSLSAGSYADFFGCSKWSRELGEAMGLCDVPKVKAGTIYSKTNLEKKKAALVRQYGPTILEWLSHCGGSFDELGAELLTIQREIASARAIGPSSFYAS